MSSEMVVHGRDGYLFLTNDVSHVMEQVEGSHVMPDELLWSIAMVHRARRAVCEDLLGCAYIHWLIPDRETALASKLPETIVPGRHGPRAIGRYRELGCAELHQPLMDVTLLTSSDRPTFFKQDTHWTWHGAHRYLEASLKQTRPDLHARLAAITFVENWFKLPGDLGSKIGSEPEDAVIGLPSTGGILPAFDNEISNFGRTRIYVNPDCDNQERILILHDSSAEWLTTMLPAIAHTCMFVHTPEFDPGFLRRFRPTLVLFSQIERFFIRPPRNDIALLPLISEQEKDKEGKKPFIAWPDFATHVFDLGG